MSLSFRERLMLDSYIIKMLTSYERNNPKEYCSISDELIREANPDSADVDSQIDSMSQDEFRRHAEEVILEYRKREKEKKPEQKKKKTMTSYLVKSAS